MRIRYLSDLHVEFLSAEQVDSLLLQIPPGPDEVCVLAGDIGNPFTANYNKVMQFIQRNFKKAFVLAGNHEYYHPYYTIEVINNYLENYFQPFENISFLNNKIEEYEGCWFVGTTLWSKVTDPRLEIADVSKIQDLDYLAYNRMHMLCVDFLEGTLADPIIQKCVVISHHVPSPNLIDVKYKTSQMRPWNQWFASDLEELIEKHQHKIQAWIYGHTHTAAAASLCGVSFYCNPIGYPRENPHVDLTRVAEIPSE
jgi:predicted phosphohydrolase